MTKNSSAQAPEQPSKPGHGQLDVFVGKWNMEGQQYDVLIGKSLKVRCTTAFSDSGNTMTTKWEHLSDDSKWQTFWDVMATKVD